MNMSRGIRRVSAAPADARTACRRRREAPRPRQLAAAALALALLVPGMAVAAPAQADDTWSGTVTFDPATDGGAVVDDGMESSQARYGVGGRTLAVSPTTDDSTLSYIDDHDSYWGDGDLDAEFMFSADRQRGPAVLGFEDGALFDAHGLTLMNFNTEHTAWTVAGMRGGVEIATYTTGELGDYALHSAAAGTEVVELEGFTGIDSLELFPAQGDVAFFFDDLILADVGQVAPANVAPVVTTSGGVTSFLAVGQGSVPVVIDGELLVSDPDSPTLAGATVRIGDGFEVGDALIHTADSASAGNIGAVFEASTGVLTLTSAGATATLAQWQTALRRVTFANASDTASTGPRTIGFSVHDGIDASTQATKTVLVERGSIPPTLSVPPAQTTTTVTPLVFGEGNAITVAGDGELTTVLSASGGILTATSGGGAAIDGNGTAEVTLTGTAAQTDAALDGLVYVPTAAGSHTIEVHTTDAHDASAGDVITLSVDNVTLVVTSGLDTGDDATTAASYAQDLADGDGLSLREALAWALGGDAITFDLDPLTPGPQGGTIVLGGSPVTVTTGVAIDGDLDDDGAADVTISAGGASRVMAVSNGVTGAQITGLTLADGVTSGGGAGLRLGAGVVITVRDTVITGNTETSSGGGGVYGDFVTLTMIDSTVSGNSSVSFGGGLRIVGGGVLNLVNSTVHDNVTTGAGAHGGGIQVGAGLLTVVNSTISGNTAAGATSVGGGLRITSGTAHVHSTTIVGNAAAGSAGGVHANGVDTFTNTVVAGNTSGAGATAAAGGSPLATGGIADDVGAIVEVSTHGYFGTTAMIGADHGSLNGRGTADLLLGDLSHNNGGRHLTHRPQSGSALLDAGSNAALPADTFDLDGDGDTAEALPQDANGNARVSGIVDIGAVEANGSPVLGGLEGGPTYIENGAPVVIAGDATVSDAELDELNDGEGDYTGASLLIVRDGGALATDVFGFAPGNGIGFVDDDLLRDGRVIAGFDTSSAGALTIVFTDADGEIPTRADVNAVLRQVTYASSSDDPGNAADLRVTVADGDGGSATALVGVAIIAVNDAPVISAPSVELVDQDVDLVFSSANGNPIGVSDVDAGSNSLAVTLTAANGLLTLGGTGGLVFTAGDGSADAAMSFTGSLTAINAALDGLRFSPDAHYGGQASLEIAVDDQGFSGTGGPQVDTVVVSITVNPVIPVVSSVGAVAVDGSYGLGDTLTLIVTFDQVVLVDSSGGVPTLMLETGAIDRSAVYVAGSGDATLTFSYTVQAGDDSADLDYRSDTALELNGATIRSLGGFDAVLTLPAVGGPGSIAGQHDIVIDGIVPDAPADLRLTAASDTGVSSSDGITGDATPAITGTAEAGSTVSLYDDTGLLDLSLLGTTSVGTGGVWSFTPSAPLADGEHRIAATATDAAGNVSDLSAVLVIVIDTASPAITSVSVPDDGVYGIGEHLDFVVTFGEDVLIGDGGSSILVVDIGGVLRQAGYVSHTADALTYRYTVAEGDEAEGIGVGGLEPNGSTIGDVAGNIADLALSGVGDARGVSVDGVVPAAPSGLGLAAASDSGVPGDGLTNDATPTITGTAEAGSTVRLLAGQEVLGSATADADGAWSIEVSAELDDGEHSLRATATDAAGNVSQESEPFLVLIDTTAPPVPELIGDRIRETAGADAVVGRLSADEIVHYVLVEGEGSADNDLFAIVGEELVLTDPAAAGAGGRTVRIAAVDAAGNATAAAFAIEVVANAAPTISGLPGQPQWVTVGVAADLADVAVADGDDDELILVLTPVGGLLGGLQAGSANGVAQSESDGVWTLYGPADALTAVLAGVTFTAATAGEASIGIALDDGHVTAPVAAAYPLRAAPAEVLTAQPADVLGVVPGGSALFEIEVAEWEAIESLVWEVTASQDVPEPDALWQTVPGAEGHSLRVPVGIDGGGWYRVVLTGRDGVVTVSDAAQLTLWEVESEVGAHSEELAERFPDVPSLVDLVPELDLAALPGLVTFTLPWSGQDSAVTVFGYSTPTYLGTFAVETGVVTFSDLLLEAGEHYLVLVGVDSKELLILHYDTAASEEPPTEEPPTGGGSSPDPDSPTDPAPAPSPSQSPSGLTPTGAAVATPGAVAAMALLAGAILLVLRRRREAGSPAHGDD